MSFIARRRRATSSALRYVRHANASHDALLRRFDLYHAADAGNYDADAPLACAML